MGTSLKFSLQAFGAKDSGNLELVDGEKSMNGKIKQQRKWTDHQQNMQNKKNAHFILKIQRIKVIYYIFAFLLVCDTNW